MNLEQYQLEFSARAGVESEPMRGFREGNAQAAAWRQQALAFERELAVALAAPVPEDLVESLLGLTGSASASGGTTHDASTPVPAAGRSAGAARRRSRGWRLPLALAAGLAGVLALGVLLRSPGLGDLPALAVEHIGHHPAALAAEGPVPLASLRQAFAGFGRQPEAVPAGLRFVSVCPLAGTGTVHMVLHDGAGPPVTAYFLRDAPARRASSFDLGGMAGHYQPLDQGGAVLLVGSVRGDPAAFAQRIDRALSPAGGAGVAVR